MKKRLTRGDYKDYYGDLMKDTDNKIYERLAEYEDAEENGTLVKLPCKVGDTVFYVNKYAYPVRIEEFIVSKIIISLTESTEAFELHFISNGKYEFLFYSRATDDVYFTRAEAEKKLEELKGETK